ncbi:hypothetical protein ACFCXF_38040 [Streptomyces virginiae]|uniref:hypothetical protein n=1 Tax=Streptomyces virginiae TaxID=1961 RepID=UPI0035D84AFA
MVAAADTAGRTGEETAIATATGAQEWREEIMAAERPAERVRALLSALRRPPVRLRSQRRPWITEFGVQKLLLAAA